MRVSTLIDLLSKVHDSDAEIFIDPIGIEVRGEAGNRTIHFIPTKLSLTSNPIQQLIDRETDNS